MTAGSMTIERGKRLTGAQAVGEREVNQPVTLWLSSSRATLRGELRQ